MVETDDWHDDLHATRLPGHDAPGRRANLEQKNRPRWISEMMIEMSLAGGIAGNVVGLRNRLRLIWILLDGE